MMGNQHDELWDVTAYVARTFQEGNRKWRANSKAAFHPPLRSVPDDDPQKLSNRILCTISILVLVAVLLLTHWLACAACASLMSRVV